MICSALVSSHLPPPGSGRPVTPGPPAAPGAGPGPAAHLSSSPKPYAEPGRPGQPAQPPDGHSELCNTGRSSVHTRGGHKQSIWYGYKHALYIYKQFIFAKLKLSLFQTLREEFLNPSWISLCFLSGSGIQIKEEPDSEDWQMADSTLNASDLNNLRVQMGDEDMDTPSGEGKRLRRVACTCPYCKESGGRWGSKIRRL